MRPCSHRFTVAATRCHNDKTHIRESFISVSIKEKSYRRRELSLSRAAPTSDLDPRHSSLLLGSEISTPFEAFYFILGPDSETRV